MRTTIDLPDDLHRIARGIAQDRHQTLSQAVADLIWAGLKPAAASTAEDDPETGFPVVHIGRVITTEDVRALQDDELPRVR